MSVVTLYAGIMFVSQQLSDALVVIIAIIVFAGNVWFWSLWIHTYMNVPSIKKILLKFIALMQKCILCRSRTENL